MFAVNGILFNHESPRRGETFVTRKITRAVARITAGLQESLYLGQPRRRARLGLRTGVRRRHVAHAAGRRARRLRGGDRDAATRCATSCSTRFAAADLEWEKYVKFDERYLRPTEVDALIGDASKARDEARLGGEGPHARAGADHGRGRPPGAGRRALWRDRPPHSPDAVGAAGCYPRVSEGGPLGPTEHDHSAKQWLHHRWGCSYDPGNASRCKGRHHCLPSSALLALLVPVVAMPRPAPAAESGAAVRERPPNVVVIMTDDQRPGTFQTMPTVRNRIRALGRGYHGIAPTSLCCPARVAFLTGNFSHTTGILGTTDRREAADGRTSTALGIRAPHVWPRHCPASGYRTALVGKYLNAWNRAPVRIRAAGLGCLPCLLVQD